MSDHFNVRLSQVLHAEMCTLMTWLEMNLDLRVPRNMLPRRRDIACRYQRNLMRFKPYAGITSRLSR